MGELPDLCEAVAEETEALQLTELAKLSYPDHKNQRVSGDEDLKRLMKGIAFPFDHVDEDHSVKDHSSPSPRRCRTCKKLDCPGVG